LRLDVLPKIPVTSTHQDEWALVPPEDSEPQSWDDALKALGDHFTLLSPNGSTKDLTRAEVEAINSSGGKTPSWQAVKDSYATIVAHAKGNTLKKDDFINFYSSLYPGISPLLADKFTDPSKVITASVGRGTKGKMEVFSDKRLT